MRLSYLESTRVLSRPRADARLRGFPALDAANQSQAVAERRADVGRSVNAKERSRRRISVRVAPTA